jgi:NMD protein affecting ribosome stability and mRNA decay
MNYFRNPLLLKNWRVLGAHLRETLCLECIASWNTYYEGFLQYCQSRGSATTTIANYNNSARPVRGAH